MSETQEPTAVAETQEAKRPARRRAAKPKSKPAKKAAAKDRPDRSAADVPAKERRASLVKLLRKLGATTGGSAVPISSLAKRLGYNAYDVYCLAYHKFPLAKGGFVKTAVVEDARDLGVYLTAKGAKVPVDQIP